MQLGYYGATSYSLSTSTFPTSRIYTDCKPCPAGQTTERFGGPCTCPIGTYAQTSSTGAVSCASCPSGFSFVKLPPTGFGGDYPPSCFPSPSPSAFLPLLGAILAFLILGVTFAAAGVIGAVCPCKRPPVWGGDGLQLRQRDKTVVMENPLGA